MYHYTGKPADTFDGLILEESGQRMCAKILLVDDDFQLRDAIKIELEFMGFEVIEAQNGAVALDIFKSQQVDFVITDHDMPVMNGVNLIKAIRETSATPIILITGGSLSEDLAKKAGATAYMTKPLRVNVLEEYLLDGTNASVA
jgi:DNA-binding response OmpR family regulator